MNISKENYRKYADARAPKSPTVKNCVRAFLVGGLICLFGEALIQAYSGLCGLSREDAGTRSGDPDFHHGNTDRARHI